MRFSSIIFTVSPFALGLASSRELERKKIRNSKRTEGDTTYSRSYTVISKPRDIVFVASPSSNGSLPGSYFVYRGGVFRPSSVRLIPKLKPDSDELDLQPDLIPTLDLDWTLSGRCTVTSARGRRSTGHSCFYDLCLGSGTDCVNIYAGGKFEFGFENALTMQTITMQHVRIFNMPRCFLSMDEMRLFTEWENRQITTGTVVKSSLEDLSSLREQAMICRQLEAMQLGDNDPDRSLQAKNTQNVGVLKPLDPNTSSRFALPPAFPGFVFGGVNRFEGIKGSFELITVAQRSPLIGSKTASPTEAPTLTDEPSQLGAPILERDLQRIPVEADDYDGQEVGVIVQKIFLVTNQRLPPGPKAV